MFPLDDVEKWAKEYPYDNDDRKVFDAGKNILAGDFSRANLAVIVSWKSNRRIGLLRENTDSEIEDALRLAVSAREPRSAIAVLKGLRGVELPVASAIMTAIHSDQFTVADWRAMQALGQPNADYYKIDFYVLQYLPECRRLASAAGVSQGRSIRLCGPGPLSTKSRARFKECSEDATSREISHIPASSICF